MKWYIAIEQTYWGRGKSIDEARNAMRKAGGKLRTHLVYEFEMPEGAEPPFIDQMGNSVTAEGSVRKLVAATRKGKAIPADALSAIDN